MITSHDLTEVRPVGHFSGVAIWTQQEATLVITQGEQEGLSISAPPDVVKRIESSVHHERLVIRTGGGWVGRLGGALAATSSRQHIQVRLAVKELRELEITGFVNAIITHLQTPCLALHFDGAGQIHLDALAATTLDCTLTGTGRINASGQVDEQRVTIAGPGHYYAPRLQSRKASLTVQATGTAVVWAVEDLDIQVSSMGNVSYYGTPRVSKNAAQAWSVASLGNP